jgi:hypothetical protein
MMRQEEGVQGRRYVYECEVCGGVWERWFLGWEDAVGYVELGDCCPGGLHVVEGGLKEAVRVREG